MLRVLTRSPRYKHAHAKQLHIIFAPTVSRTVDPLLVHAFSCLQLPPHGCRTKLEASAPEHLGQPTLCCCVLHSGDAPCPQSQKPLTVTCRQLALGVARSRSRCCAAFGHRRLRSQTSLCTGFPPILAAISPLAALTRKRRHTHACHPLAACILVLQPSAPASALALGNPPFLGTSAVC